jgi:uncharacterized hydrophobic protein (TIGR00271 family)
VPSLARSAGTSDPVGTILRELLHLRLSAHQDRSEPIGRRLESIDGVRRVLSARTPGEPEVVVTADVSPDSADELLEILMDLEVGSDDYVLTRLDVVAPIMLQQHDQAATQGFAWLEVLGEARTHSRPLGRYLAMMAVAGVIAALGVIESNSILIVGAMAVSPDLLPVCSLGVGIVGRRWALVRTAAGTLVIGLLLIALVATLLTFMLGLTGILEDFDVADSSIAPLAAHTDYSTLLVALAAGVAAMLSFETRASAAVGVAISVTTIPASAYFGVAFGNGEATEAWGALLVLGINVLLLILSTSLTLGVQRRLAPGQERGTAAVPGRASR